MTAIKHIIAVICYILVLGSFAMTPPPETYLVMIFLVTAVIIHSRFWFITIAYTTIYTIAGIIGFFIGMKK